MTAVMQLPTVSRGEAEAKQLLLNEALINLSEDAKNFTDLWHKLSGHIYAASS